MFAMHDGKKQNKKHTIQNLGNETFLVSSIFTGGTERPEQDL